MQFSGEKQLRQLTVQHDRKTTDVSWSLLAGPSTGVEFLKEKSIAISVGCKNPV